LEKVACGAFSDVSFVSAGKNVVFASCVLKFPLMEINQLKRFIKDLEERTDSLRRYL
jgi:hypothetical protein